MEKMRFFRFAAIFLFVSGAAALRGTGAQETSAAAENTAAGQVVPERNRAAENTGQDSESASESTATVKSGDTEDSGAEESAEGAKDGEGPTAAEKDAVVEEEDMLIIEGEEEENIIDEEIVAPAEKVQVHDSAAKAVEAPPAQEQVSRPPPKTGPYPSPRSSFTPPEKTATEQTVQVDPRKAVIEEERSINFAKNLREYRSPRVAMVLSLFIPGLGQAYAKKYFKTGIFAVAEAAIIGVGVNFALKGRDEKDNARSFADTHFDINRFWTYFGNLDSLLRMNTTFTDTMIEDVKRTAVWDSAEFAGDAAVRNNAYYQQLERDPMSQGWSDCEPKINMQAGGIVEESPEYSYSYRPMAQPGSGDTVWLVYQIDKTSGDTLRDLVWGYSELQGRYTDMVRESNRYYRISTNVLFLLLANHLISAVDAMISAKAHNDALLGKQSWWRRINLDQQIAYHSNTGIMTNVGVKVRF